MSYGPINSVDKLPWGWHFRPTGAELINNLKKKVRRQRQERRSFEPEDISEVLREIDLSQVEPWEIKEIPETCSIRATHADELNQYFYTQKEQKYRHGKRSNRATRRGFWKATGRDKPIYGKLNSRDRVKRVVGYRKALVFYEGRAPNGNKTDWILHEYRLENGPDAASRDSEQWVACHMFIKERNIPGPQSRETQETAVDVETDSVQDHPIEWPELQHGQSVKPEPGLNYPISYPHVTASALVSTRNSEQEPHLQYSRSGVMVDDCLPRLVSEEITYPVHSIRPVVEAVAQPPRPTTNRLPSFDNDRIISELLFGIYEQHPSSQHQPYPADDRLWLP